MPNPAPRRAFLALLALILLGLLAWRPSTPRAASADATPVFLPQIMREGLLPNPGQLNSRDWVYNFSGVFNGSSVAAALDYHVANKPLMVLPIQDLAAISGGVNSNYHVARPGAFLLIGYRLSGPAYLDLVYIEEPATLPCTG